MVNNTYNDLFKNLNQSSIKYVSWKNNNELSEALDGQSDIDLLVEYTAKDEFIRVLGSFDFVEAIASVNKFPFISHYYKYDDTSRKTLHIHVYYKLITGESHTKNYLLPIEDSIFESSSENEFGVKVPCQEHQIKLFLIRHYIKVSCLPGLLLYIKSAKEYKDEFEFYNNVNNDFSLPFGNDVIDNIDYHDLYSGLEKSMCHQVLLGFKLRFLIHGFNRFSSLKGFAFRYTTILYRAFNKLIGKRKKSLSRGGVIVAITGLDGTGKSTTVEHLHSTIGKHIDTEVIHVGIPKTTFFTWPFRAALALYKKKKSDESQKSKAEASSKKRLSNLMALRYCILAYERYRAIKKARYLAEKGTVVITDRFPSRNIGVMDSRRIEISNDNASLINWLGKLEHRYYSFCDKPDLLINLSVPLSVSIERNRNRVKKDKETDMEIEERYRDNSGLDFFASKVIKLDMSGDKDECLNEVSSLVWKAISQ